LRQIQPTPDIENNVVLYYALFDVANPDGDLMISMSAQVFFVESAAKDVLIVQSSALNTVSGSRRAGPNGEPRKAEVTVLNSSGATETRAVEVGIRNRVNAEIRSGLKEGELVVVGTGSDSSATSANRGTNNRSQRTMRMPPMF
jgi:membrane fusion protein, macrolide-specific efflux system